MIGQGLKIAGAIAKPVAAVLPVSMVGGVAVAHVLAIALLLLICFIAGLLARLAIARRAVGALEANVLSRVPANALLKTKTQSMLSADDIEGMSVVVGAAGRRSETTSTAWGGSPRDRARGGGKVAFLFPAGLARSLVRLGLHRGRRTAHALDLPVWLPPHGGCPEGVSKALRARSGRRWTTRSYREVAENAGRPTVA